MVCGDDLLAQGIPEYSCGAGRLARGQLAVAHPTGHNLVAAVPVRAAIFRKLGVAIGKPWRRCKLAVAGRAAAKLLPRCGVAQAERAAGQAWG